MRRGWVWAGLLFFMVSGYSAEIADLESAFERRNYDTVREQLPEVAQQYPRHPTVLFMRGFFHSHPDSAAQLYAELLDNDPNNKYADQAAFRLGQYHYVRENYGKARRLFSNVFKTFPSSLLKDDAQYLYCQSILAQGKVDSAKLFLKAFVQNVNRSPLVDAAILDLEHLGGLARDRLAQEAPRREIETPRVYTIQVAAFRNYQNAKNAHYRLARIFSHVEIGERTLGNTQYYIIFVGQFSSRDKAERYADLYIAPYLKDYKIVTKAET